ncbi:MAG: hypothetical protein WD766_13865 [Gemmatimonadota bacterium]
MAEAEAAHRRGEIQEYFLFPAAKLRKGKAPVAQCEVQPLNPTAVRDMFRYVEDLAGVPHQPGRALYGLRRQATDLAPEFEHDSRVLNRLSGHKESTTRERIYQDPKNERVAARAAKARRKMRRHLRALTEGDGNEAAEPTIAPNLSQTYPTPRENEKAPAAQTQLGLPLT